MTEFQELIQDAPNFVSMERGELVAYAYGMFAAGTKADVENAKLRELCGFMLRCMKRNHDCDCCLVNGEHCEISYIESDARELGVEVDE